MKQNHLTGSYGWDIYKSYNVSLHVYLLIVCSNQAVPSAVTQRMIVKFLINENVRPA